MDSFLSIHSRAAMKPSASAFECSFVFGRLRISSMCDIPSVSRQVTIANGVQEPDSWIGLDTIRRSLYFSTGMASRPYLNRLRNQHEFQMFALQGKAIRACRT